MNICVYAASSNTVHEDYLDAAARLGTLLADHGHTLVYGGGQVGLMGALARAVHAGGGRVVGVIPDRLRNLELAYKKADELVVTCDIRHRKGVMEERAEAFVALPGGYGTIEEVLETLVQKQLGYHNKPLIFINTRGAYDELDRFFDHLMRESFI